MYMICYKFTITRHQTCVVDFSFVFTIVYQTKINCPALVSFFWTWVSYGVIFNHFFGHKNNTKITYKYIWATIWYFRCLSTLNVLGQNEVMAWRAPPSDFFALTDFFAMLAASSENDAHSIKRDWRAALSCMPCLAFASSDTNRLWSLRSFGGLSICASLIQPSAMPQHTVGAICTWHHFISFWKSMDWIGFKVGWPKCNQNTYHNIIIHNPLAKHWTKHGFYMFLDCF